MMLQYKSSIVDSCMFVNEYKLPSDEGVKLTTRYTEPVIIQKSKEQTEKYRQIYMKSAHASGASTSSQLLSNDKNQSIRIDQLFSPDRDGNIPKTVILSGDSGRGKSFILQKIMLDWASGELYAKNFDIVFLLNCEELMSLSEEMTLTELLSWSCSLPSDEISEILELTPEKVLFLVDGVDEYKPQPCSYLVSPQNNPSKRALPLVNLKNLSRGILLPQSFMLITTTSVAVNALMNLLRGPQRFTEIEGFSERGVQEYFQKFFQDEQLFRKTYESVKTNETLLTHCSVPLLCWMVCFCLKKRFKDQVIKELNTTTSIYVQFVSTLLEDHPQSQSLLRSLGQLAKKGMKKRHVLFEEKTVNKTVSDPAASVFLLKTKGKPEPVFRFMHLSFQRFFTALHFFLDKTNHWWKTADRLSSYLISSDHLLFIYGLLNKKVHSQLFNGCDWSSSDMIKLKTELQKELLKIISTMSKQCRVKLLALHCVYELQDEDLTRRALAGWVSVDLSNVSLRSTFCLVLLYCLRFCPHIRDLNLMHCDLTADKLKILQPALALCETLRLSLTFSKKNPLFPTVLNLSLTCALSSTGWTLLLQRLSRAGKLAKNFLYHDEHISLLLSSFRSVGLKTMDLKLVSLNESCVSGIIALFQNCTSLQQLSLNISEASALDLHCQSCVHIADSDQWLQVEPSVCKDKRGSEFRISTQAGRFQCSRTRMRWVCDGDVTLHYRAVDGQFLNTDLEKLQCERIAPVFDVNVISGKLEEAHLPHYICLAESDPALTDNVKLLSKRDDGISLQSVELSRYHAKIVQPSFSLTTLIINWFIKREEHCNLLIYMRLKDPLILHIYFFPVNDTWSKEKVEQREKSSFLISHPRPNKPFRMKTPHLLTVPGASVHPVEGISFRADVEPNFFKLRKKCQDDDVQMNLIREEDKKSVWTATIWKDELAQLNLSEVQGEPQLNSENANQFFNTHRWALIDRVRNVRRIADQLHAQGVINRELYSDILQNNLTSQDNMRKICDLVYSGGVAAQNKFIEILKEEEPCLLEDLGHSGS